MAAWAAVESGEDNPLLELLRSDPETADAAASLGTELDPAEYTGRSAEQVLEFLEEEVEPLLAELATTDIETAEIEEPRV